MNNDHENKRKAETLVVIFAVLVAMLVLPRVVRLVAGQGDRAALIENQVFAGLQEGGGKSKDDPAGDKEGEKDDKDTEKAGDK